MTRLAPARRKIRALSRSHRVEFSRVAYSRSAPALYFDDSVVRRIAELGANLDIDLYIG